MIAAAAIFSPTPEAAAGLLADLDDCSLSFDELARKHGTSTDALALWLSTDDIKDRIQQSLDAMALRIRRLATSRLPAALRVISHIVESSEVAPLSGAASLSQDPNSPDYRLEREYRRRHNESIRRAATLLLRLANFFSPTRPPPSPRSLGRGPEAWRGGEGSDERPPTSNGAHSNGDHRHQSPSPRSSGQGLAVARRSVEALRDDEGSDEGRSVTNGAHSNGAHCHQPSIETLTDLLRHWESTDASGPGQLEPAPRQSPTASNRPDISHQDASPASRPAPHFTTKDQGTSTKVSSLSASSASSALTSSPPSAVAEPRPPPLATYQRPRQRFKVRR